MFARRTATDDAVAVVLVIAVFLLARLTSVPGVVVMTAALGMVLALRWWRYHRRRE